MQNISLFEQCEQYLVSMGFQKNDPTKQLTHFSFLLPINVLYDIHLTDVDESGIVYFRSYKYNDGIYDEEQDQTVIGDIVINNLDQMKFCVENTHIGRLMMRLKDHVDALQGV